MSREARKFPRRNLDRLIGCLSHGNYHVAKLSQLGEGGCMFESEFVLEAGDTVVLTLKVPNGEFFCAGGKILYAKRGKETSTMLYGCQFSQTNLNVKRSIRAFVADKTELEAKDDFDLH